MSFLILMKIIVAALCISEGSEYVALGCGSRGMRRERGHLGGGKEGKKPRDNYI